MKDSIPSLSPEVCRRLDVHCEGCIRSRARTISRISPNLSDQGAERLFQLLYPSAGCAPMRSQFVAELRESMELRLSVSTRHGAPLT